MRTVRLPTARFGPTDGPPRLSDSQKLRIYEHLLDRLPEAVAVLDAKGEYVEVNAAHSALMGGSTGRGAMSPAANLDAEAFADLMETLQTTGAFRKHVTWHRSDEEPRRLDLTGMAVRDEAGRLLACVTVAADVTYHVEAASLLTAMRERSLSTPPADAERALREPSGLAAAIMGATTDVVFVKDLQRRYLHMNVAGCQAVGRPLEEVIGKRDQDLWPADLVAQCAETDAVVLGTGTALTAEEVTTVGGRTITYVTAKAPYRDDRGRIVGIVGIARDSSDRKAWEQALRQSEERLHEALQASNTGLWYWNTRTNEVQFSREWKRQLGYEEWEVADTFDAWEGRLHPEDRERAMAYVRAYVGNPVADYYQEFRLRHKNGTYRWMVARASFVTDPDGRRERLLGSHVDISERKRVEEALRMSEERLALAVHGSTDAVWDAHRLPGRPWYAPENPIWWSPRIREFLSLDRDEEFATLGQWVARLHEEDRDRVMAELAAHAQQRAPYDTEYRLRTNRGDYRWIRGRGQAMWDEVGEPYRMAGSCQDIMDRKCAEAAIARRLEFERLVASLSTQFIELSVHAVDQGIVHALEAIGRFTESDRAYVFLFREQGRVVDNTHEWCAEGVPSQQAFLQALPTEAFAWIMERHRRGEITHIVRLSDLPAEAQAEREEFEREGIRSLLVLPIPGPTGVLGFVGFDSVHAERAWGEDEVSLLKIVGEMLGHVLGRKRTEAALRQSEERYRLLSDLSPMGMFVLCEGRTVYVNQATCRLLGASTVEEVLSRPAMAFVHPTCREVVMESMHALMGGAEAVRRAERQYIRLDGTVMDVEVEAAPTMWEGKRAIQGIFSDITARKRTEHALRASEELFSKAFRSSPYPLVISEIETGRCLDANAAAIALLGYEREEVAGKTADDLHLWPSPAAREAFVRQLKPDGSLRNLDVTFRHKSGSWRRCLVSAEMIEFHGKACMVTVGHDVTEQKRVEAALGFARFSVERAVEAIYWVDPAARILDVNEAACRMLGYSKAEFTAMTVHDINPLFAPDAWAAFWEETKRRGASLIEAFHRAKDGQLIPVEITVNYLDYGGREYHCAFVRDVSERRRAETALQLSEERFAKAFRASPHPIMITEMNTGKILDANRAACEAFGYEPETVVGQTTLGMKLWAVPSDRDRFFAQLSAEGGIRDFQVSLRSQIGAIRDFLVSSEKITLGGVPCLVTVGTDITERRRAERALLQVAEGVSAVTGEAFFYSLVRHLSEALSVDYVVVARPVDPGRARLRTVAVFGQGQPLENFEYDLAGTPCERAMNEGLPCVVQSGVQQAFPAFALFASLGVDSYLGIPLISSDGTVLGLVGLMNRGPLEQHPQAESLLKIFVSRAAAELARQEAETALRESEGRYRTLVESIRDLVYLVSPDGLILSLNPAFETRFGWGRGEWIGKPFLDLVYPEDRSAAAEAMERALAGSKDTAVEVRLMTAQGGWVFVECAGGHYEEHDVMVGVLGVARDLTVRKQAEAALAESRTNLRRITDAIPGVVYQYRVGTDGSEGFPFASRGTKELLGCDSWELEADATIGWAAVLPEDLPGLTASIAESASALAPWTYEFRVRDQSGRVKWLRGGSLPERQADGAIVWYGLFTDVTGQRQAEQQLRFTQFAMDHAADAVLIAGPDMRIVYANHEACRSLGYTQEELLEHTMGELAPQYAPERFAERLALLKQGERVHYETVHRTKDGRGVPVDVSVRYLEQEGVGYFCAMARDMTERQQFEQRLRHADRLATLGTITAGVAHELNNPLFVISGHLHLIERNLARRQVKAIRKELIAAQEAAQRASEIVTQFLYTAHASAGVRERCDLASIARKALALLQSDFRSHRVTVTSRLADHTPSIVADPQALLQVFLNLLTNARQAVLGSEGKGRIHVSVGMVEGDGGAVVEGRVEDNGPGIAPEHLPRIFDPFFTTKAVGEGTGLGLAICRRIVSELSGTITCSSVPGQGASFVVRIPVRPPL